MKWKLFNVLGGLLILLDFINAGKLPFNLVPNGGRLPFTNGGLGSIMSSMNFPSSLTSIANNLPSMASQTILQQLSPQVSPQEIASAPQLSSSSQPGASQQIVQSATQSVLPAPQSSQPSSQSTSPPQLPPSSPQSVPLGTQLPPPGSSPGRPNYSPPNPGNSNMQSSQISQETFSQHSGGSSPVVAALDQAVSSLGPESKPEDITEGLNLVLEAIDPASIINGPVQQPSQQIPTPSGIDGAIQTDFNNEQNQASHDISNNLIQPVSAQPESSQYNEVEMDDEEVPQFDLEAYLAQANFVLNNNANYYSPPPTVSNSVNEEQITEPVAPVAEIIPSIAPSVPSETFSLAASVTENATFQQQNFPSPQPAPISTSTQGQDSGETIVIVTTAGNLGSDSVHVINSSQAPQLENTTMPSSDGTYQLASQNGPFKQAEPEALEILQPPAQNVTSPNSHSAPIKEAQQPQPEQEVSPSPENVAASLDQGNKLPPQNYIENEAPQSIPPLAQHVPEYQNEVQPTVAIVSTVNEEQKMPPTPPEVLSIDQPPQSVPPSNHNMPPAPVESQHPNHPASSGQISHSEVQQQGLIPQNAEMQTFIPVPNDSPPSNIIFEAPITDAGQYNGIPNSGAPPPGIHVPPGYMFIPLAIPPDSEGTLTISAVPLENSNEEVTAYYNKVYPPKFNVDDYLAQAALFVGSSPHASQTHVLHASKDFQPSRELHDGETAIHIIAPPSLLTDISVKNGGEAELAEPDTEELIQVEAVTSVGDNEHLPIIHSEAELVQVITSFLSPSESGPILHFYQNGPQLTSSFEENISPVPVIPLIPEHYEESGAHDENLIHPESIVHLSYQPIDHVDPQSEHFAALLDDNLNAIQELSLDDLSLLNTSALEALAAESDSDNSLDHQTIIPVFFVDENSMSSETSSENFESNGESQWTTHPFPMLKIQEPNHDDNMGLDRSKPARPIGSPGLGRPSSMGVAPMHSYTGGKLNPLIGSVSSISDDGKKINGSYTGSKNQNNGSWVMNDNKNPQNGMLSMIGNTLFNSHVSSDQPTQFTVPANAASFILAQGQKLPFHLSPPFNSILRPQLTHLQNNGPIENGSDNDINSNANTDSGAMPNSGYNNYYNPEDSVRNGTVLIQNSMIRPLISSPVFLVVNTNSKQGTNSSEMEVQVLPSAESNFNSSLNNGSLHLVHLVKRTTPNSKSIVSGENNSSVELPSSSSLNVKNLVSQQAQSSSKESNQVEVAGTLDKNQGDSNTAGGAWKVHSSIQVHHQANDVNGPISQPPPTAPHYHTHKHNEMLMKQHSNEEDMNGEVSDDYNNRYYGNEVYYFGGNGLVSPPTIPAVPSPTINKALPGKYGNGRPSVVPSVAEFAATYISQPPGSITTSGTYSTNPSYGKPSSDKECPCNSKNNNNNSPGSSASTGSEPPTPQSASQLEPTLANSAGDYISFRPSKPNKPERPQKGDKNPKPGEKNAEKLKDSDDEEERPGHLSLVSVLNKPNYSEIKEANKKEEPSTGSEYEEQGMTLIAVLKKPNHSEMKGGNKGKDHAEDVSSMGSNENDGGAESEIVEERPMIPIKVTFVNNNDTKPAGGPIKVTFLSADGSKTDSKKPIKVTFVGSDPGVSKNEKTPTEFTNVSSNHTKSNLTAMESSNLFQDDPTDASPKPPPKQSELLTTVNWYGWEVPAINWSYFTDLFISFFGKNSRTSSGEFTCDEWDDDSPDLRSELDVDYLCGEEYSRMDTGSQLDSNVCNMFCNFNGFHSGLCLPPKSCLCYLSEEKIFGIKLERLPDHHYTNDTEKMSSNSMDDFSDSSCQNCHCLKSCQKHKKYIGYCSKSCHCGVPWYNQSLSISSLIPKRNNHYLQPIE